MEDGISSCEDKIKDCENKIDERVDDLSSTLFIEETTHPNSNIVITDSAKMPLRGLKLFEKSTQVTTTGKNLFNFSKIKFPYSKDKKKEVIKRNVLFKK